MEFADAELIADFVVESQEGLADIEQQMLAIEAGGAAKTKLEEYKLTIGLPMVVCGKAQAIAFPSQAQPIVIPFDSAIGPICVQVGLVECVGN